MAYAYHGGRLYLPRHPQRRVYELHDGALYFAADLTRFGKLRPAVAEPRVRLDRPHAAWVVLCHNDWLGRQHPELCVRNIHGDIYSYALCPSQPEVQDYAVELCRQAAAQPNVDELDLEALSFMGYTHQSLHEKRAVEVDVAALSRCHCDRCREAPSAPWDLLARIRSEVKTRLNLRLSLDPDFRGGKFACGPDELPRLSGLVDAVTLTFFGLPVTFTRPETSLEVHAGIEPFANIAACSNADEVAFYLWSLAGQEAADWMEQL